MEPVPTELILDPKKNQDTAGDAYGQTGDIDQGKGFVALDVSPGDR
jgi:hypothetical protein